jgi:nucleoid DNA-binding protein
MIELEQGTKINKKSFCELIYKKLQERGYDIEFIHIQSVINIFIKELKSLLLKGKTFRIYGFGRLVLQKMPPRPHFNFKIMQVETRPNRRNKLRFLLQNQFHNQLLKIIDVEKTFPEITNEETK